MSLDRHHARLLAALFATLGAVPVCAAGVGCSGGSLAPDGDGGADGGIDAAGDTGIIDRMNCGGSQMLVQQTTGVLCADASTDAGDGGEVDADVDAGDPDAGDGAATCFATCEEACLRAFPQYFNGTAKSCVLGTGDAIVCSYTVSHPCGRGFPELLPSSGRPGGSNLGALFAEAAWMEAASITAFRRLARELAIHAAPRELVVAARDAARDEIRHARAMARLARRFGAEVPRVEHAPIAMRSLEELAIENAREGCVGETYGAALASWQARHARDAEVREAMCAIAGDELRHAALGHAIGEWAFTKLDAMARARVDAETRDAIAMLAKRVVAETVPDDVVLGAGMPAPRDALRMVAAVSALAA